MAVIGMLGGILFQVSDRQVLNFSKLQRSVSGKWSQYDVLGRKAVSVFLGPELQEVTLNVTLNAVLGVKPRQLLELMARMVESGTPAVLLIGPRRIGQNQWVLTKSSEAWNRVYAHGELVQAETSLTLKEYVAEVIT